jgi:Cu(I)/Ag(I) efflux system membrane fusion protein
MFAEVVIYGGPKADALLIPADALIETGERTSVIKALGEGRFQPVDVVTGATRAGRVEILNGLEEGDEVVISGQFLIDSESSLQASFLRMEE